MIAKEVGRGREKLEEGPGNREGLLEAGCQLRKEKSTRRVIKAATREQQQNQLNSAAVGSSPLPQYNQLPASRNKNQTPYRSNKDFSSRFLRLVT